MFIIHGHPNLLQMFSKCSPSKPCHKSLYHGIELRTHWAVLIGHDTCLVPVHPRLESLPADVRPKSETATQSGCDVRESGEDLEFRLGERVDWVGCIPKSPPKTSCPVSTDDAIMMPSSLVLQLGGMCQINFTAFLNFPSENITSKVLRHVNVY